MTGPERDAVGSVDYDALYEQSAVPILTINHQQRRIIRANPAALALLGLEAGQVIGRPGTDFLTKPSQRRLAQIRAIRGDETALLMDVPTVRGPRSVEINIVPSGVEGVAFVELLDLTDLLDAAARADARYEELSRTSDALRTMGSRLAHDLRGPLVTVAGFARLLLENWSNLSAEERAELLRRVHANITALAAMTDSILGQADAGASQSDDASHEVDDLIRVIRELTEAQLAECGGALEVRSSVATLPVSVGTIRQAVLNLISNSIKYRDPVRPLRIELTVTSSDLGTDIEVRDNGRGLPPDVAPLFDVGARGDAATGTTGTGLGLAFARAAVESVGGSIRGLGLAEGAEFVITLPGARAEQPPTDQPPSAADAAGSDLTSPQLARVLDASPIAAVAIDVALRQIVFVNRAGVALLGADERDILGRPGSDFVDEQDIAEALRRRVLDEPDAATPLHTRLRTANGDVPTRIWITFVEGTALAVAQMVADDVEP